MSSGDMNVAFLTSVRRRSVTGHGSLTRDRVILVGASDLIFQVHPTEPGQEATLESLELIATEVAPALGRVPATAAVQA
jgi:hypothetical protein